jgi:TonB family protein
VSGLLLILSACAGPETPPPPCRFRETGFYAGVNPPRQILRAAPDLSGLPPLVNPTVVIVEVRIDATGAVTETCLRRGVRDDVDARVLAAVQQWRFDPPRLKRNLELEGSRTDAGTAVPIFMTVTVPVP